MAQWWCNCLDWSVSGVSLRDDEKLSQIERVNGSTEVVRFPRYLSGTEVGDNIILGYA
jgi:hypothetical protein